MVVYSIGNGDAKPKKAKPKPIRKKKCYSSVPITALKKELKKQVDARHATEAKAPAIIIPDSYTTRKGRSESRLINYIEDVWHVVEPKRPFRNGWIIGAVCEHLEAITLGQITQLLINVPPGCMKSMATSVFWPTWEWGPRDLPNLRHLNFSYSPSLTIRDNRKARRIIESPFYRKRWGSRFELTSDQNQKIKFENDKTGWMFATSVGGVGTGERADRTKLDDPHNVQDGESELIRNNTVTWFRETLSTRVNDQLLSAFLVIMQRVNEEDVSGCIIAEEFGYTHLMLPMRFDGERGCKTIYLPNSIQCQATGKPWEDPRSGKVKFINKRERLVEGGQRKLVDYTIGDVYGFQPVKADELERTPVIIDTGIKGNGGLAFPELFPLKAVKSLETKLGDYATAAQLDQRPGPRKGGMFKREKFQIVDTLPAGLIAVRGWDLAGTKKTGNVSARQSATANVLIGIDPDGRLFIGDMNELFISAGELNQCILTTAQMDDVTIFQSLPQDPGQAGLSQKASFTKLLHGFRFEVTPESGDKIVRAQPFSAQVEAGNVYMIKAAWNSKLLDRFTMFPNGRKDVVDAASRAYDKIVRLTGRKTLVAAMPLTENSAGGYSGGEGAPHLGIPMTQNVASPVGDPAAQVRSIIAERHAGRAPGGPSSVNSTPGMPLSG